MNTSGLPMSDDAQQYEAETTSEQMSRKRRRVVEACENCRARKTRCDGGWPKCAYCLKYNYTCNYTSRVPKSQYIAKDEYVLRLQERVRSLKEALAFTKAQTTNDSLGHARPLSPDGESSNQAEKSPICEATPMEERLIHHTGIHDEARQDISTYADAPIASGERLSIFNTPDPVDAMATIPSKRRTMSRRYFGSSSSISLVEQILASIIPPGPSKIVREVLNQSTVSQTKAPTEVVDPTAIPSEATAKMYFDLYFEHAHTYYPFINEDEFRKTYNKVKIEGYGAVTASWLAQMNLIIALAIITMRDEKKTIEERGQESLLYVRRAWHTVGPNALGGETFEFLQVLVLKSMYLQSTNHANHCWNVAGLAIRIAQSLGLHDPQTYANEDLITKEYRKRTWCMCLQLDRTLAMTYGRPPSVGSRTEVVDMPLELANEPRFEDGAGGTPSVALFTASTKLSCLMGDALETLYANNPKEVDKDPSRRLEMIVRLEQMLEDWRVATPASLRPAKEGAESRYSKMAAPLLRSRFVLAFRYHNLRILIHRVLLLRALSSNLLREYSDGVAHDFADSIAERSGEICIQSAIAIVQIARTSLDVKPNVHLLGAWWFSLYYSMYLYGSQSNNIVFNSLLIIFASLFTHLNRPMNTLDSSDAQFVEQNAAFEQGLRLIRDMALGNRAAERIYQFLKRLMETLQSQPSYSQGSIAAGPILTPSSSTRRTLTGDDMIDNHLEYQRVPVESLTEQTSGVSQDFRPSYSDESSDVWNLLLNQSAGGLNLTTVDSWNWLINNEDTTTFFA